MHSNAFYLQLVSEPKIYHHPYCETWSIITIDEELEVQEFKSLLDYLFLQLSFKSVSST